MKKIKFYFNLLKLNTIYFFNHPIKFIKDYIEDFKKCSILQKIKKLILTAIGVYLVFYAIGAVFVILLGLAMCGIVVPLPNDDESIEMLTNAFRARHGEDPQNLNNVYRG